MSAASFPSFLTFVWRKGFDSPDDGYHVTAGDPGLGTNGGVIEATWEAAIGAGVVSGTLQDATRDQLSAVLRWASWGSICDDLPPGIDLMVGNGRMMSGHYPVLFQQCLGFIGDGVDGNIGPETQSAVRSAAPATLINALTGAHYAYLTGLSTWQRNRGGWTTRLEAARDTALAMVRGANPAA